MEETINLKEIFYSLKKRIALIVGVIFTFLILAAIFTFFIATPRYEASTQILVNQAQNDEQPITVNELQSNREFINTYNVIITSPIILETVIQETGIDTSVEDLQSQISVSAEGESQVVILSVEDEDPQNATTLVNTTAQVFEEEVSNIMNVDNVSILSESQASNTMDPVSPQPLLNMLIALVLGVILGVALAILLEFLDQTIKTEQDVEKTLNMPILGSIPFIVQNDENDKKRSSI